MSYLRYLFVCVEWCPTHTGCVCLRIVYPMLPVSMDFQFFIALRYSLTFMSGLLVTVIVIFATHCNIYNVDFDSNEMKDK